MTRNAELQWLILKFGISGPHDDLGRSTNISELWHEARGQFSECDMDELLDALYTLPREQAALIKWVSAGDELHPVSFERIRNTKGWTYYFLDGDFSVKVLPEGRVHWQKLSEELAKVTAVR